MNSTVYSCFGIFFIVFLTNVTLIVRYPWKTIFLGKLNVTPGAIIPARELLGELLLELKRPGEALKEFEVSLICTPNRCNSLYRAAQAARLAGDQFKANRYDEQFQQLTASGQPF